jgi:membrane peptidoglycan carboxypeptidase
VNDHRNSRHRMSEPAWPTGDEPAQQRDEQQERTGFWSPLWEDDDEPPQRPAARPGGVQRGPAPQPNGGGNGHGHTTQLRRPQTPPPPPGGPANQPTMPVRPAVGAPSPGPAGRTTALPGGRRTQGPRDNSQDPTEMMAPVGASARREPDLLTHREGEEFDEDDYLGDEEPRPLGEDQKRKRRKKIWRRVRRTLYVFTALMIIGPILAFLIAYQVVDVPSPKDIAANQSREVFLKYADGSDLAKIVPEDGSRQMVNYEDIPKQVLNAVFAAEDATFMTNSGFDLTGVMRAGWNQLTGGEGGGSTITQQYIKKATGNDEKSLTRKGLEVVKAYKMNRTYSKEDIITAYLNTIYLGRNSYGIAAAAKAWYAKDLKALTPSEAALLAGMIQGPGKYKDTDYQQRRWNYVMDRLVANNWYPADQRKIEKFPTPVPYEQTKAQKDIGPRGLLERAALDEVERTMNLTREDLQLGGYTIVTTIDPQAQTLAEQAVDEVMKDQLPKHPELRPGLVAVDPTTGAIKAYYGGADGTGTDWASAKQEPGSSFKPFDLVALLEKGKGLNDVYDGTSPRKFGNGPNPLTIRNSENAQCPNCTVAEAMKRSINTVFYDITLNEVGTGKVADAAAQAGITSQLRDDSGNAPTAGIAIGGDKTQVSTLEMASAYGTFAARGWKRTPHLVEKVLTHDGQLYQATQVKEEMAFDPANPRRNEQIARNVTESLLPVPKSSGIPCSDNRLCAGKTGTHQYGETADNAKAWMVGYTPQISAAVSMSADKGGPIKNAAGKIIFGSGLPGQIWQKFMNSYHKTFKLAKMDFGHLDMIGKKTDQDSTSSTSNKPNNATQDPPDRRGPGNGRQQPSDKPDPTTTTPRRGGPQPPPPFTIPTRPNQP